MARSFSNASAKPEELEWKKLKRYSGDPSSFYVKHDTFISSGKKADAQITTNIPKVLNKTQDFKPEQSSEPSEILKSKPSIEASPTTKKFSKIKNKDNTEIKRRNSKKILRKPASGSKENNAKSFSLENKPVYEEFDPENVTDSANMNSKDNLMKEELIEKVRTTEEDNKAEAERRLENEEKEEAERILKSVTQTNNSMKSEMLTKEEINMTEKKEMMSGEEIINNNSEQIAEQDRKIEEDRFKEKVNIEESESKMQKEKIAAERRETENERNKEEESRNADEELKGEIERTRDIQELKGTSEKDIDDYISQMRIPETLNYIQESQNDQQKIEISIFNEADQLAKEGIKTTLNGTEIYVEENLVNKSEQISDLERLSEENGSIKANRIRKDERIWEEMQMAYETRKTDVELNSEEENFRNAVEEMKKDFENLIDIQEFSRTEENDENEILYDTKSYKLTIIINKDSEKACISTKAELLTAEETITTNKKEIMSFEEIIVNNSKEIGKQKRKIEEDRFKEEVNVEESESKMQVEQILNDIQEIDIDQQQIYASRVNEAYQFTEEEKNTKENRSENFVEENLGKESEQLSDLERLTGENGSIKLDRIRTDEQIWVEIQIAYENRKTDVELNSEEENFRNAVEKMKKYFEKLSDIQEFTRTEEHDKEILSKESEQLSQLERLAEDPMTFEEKQRRIVEEEMLTEAANINKDKRLMDEERNKEEQGRMAEEEMLKEAAKRAEDELVKETARIKEDERLMDEERIKEEHKIIAEEEMLKEAAKKAEDERLLENAENEKIELAKREAEAERRVAEAERIAEIERISKAEQLAEKERLAELERIAAENNLQEEVRITEAKQLMEQQRILEQSRILELQEIKIALILAEAEKERKQDRIRKDEQIWEEMKIAYKNRKTDVELNSEEENFRNAVEEMKKDFENLIDTQKNENEKLFEEKSVTQINKDSEEACISTMAELLTAEDTITTDKKEMTSVEEIIVNNSEEIAEQDRKIEEDRIKEEVHVEESKSKMQEEQIANEKSETENERNYFEDELRISDEKLKDEIKRTRDIQELKICFEEHLVKGSEQLSDLERLTEENGSIKVDRIRKDEQIWEEIQIAYENRKTDFELNSEEENFRNAVENTKNYFEKLIDIQEFTRTEENQNEQIWEEIQIAYENRKTDIELNSEEENFRNAVEKMKKIFEKLIDIQELARTEENRNEKIWEEIHIAYENRKTDVELNSEEENLRNAVEKMKKYFENLIDMQEFTRTEENQNKQIWEEIQLAYDNRKTDVELNFEEENFMNAVEKMKKYFEKLIDIQEFTRTEENQNEHIWEEIQIAYENRKTDVELNFEEENFRNAVEKVKIYFDKLIDIQEFTRTEENQNEKIWKEIQIAYENRKTDDQLNPEEENFRNAVEKMKKYFEKLKDIQEFAGTEENQNEQIWEEIQIAYENRKTNVELNSEEENFRNAVEKMKKYFEKLIDIEEEENFRNAAEDPMTFEEKQRRIAEEEISTELAKIIKDKRLMDEERIKEEQTRIAEEEMLEEAAKRAKDELLKETARIKEDERLMEEERIKEKQRRIAEEEMLKEAAKKAEDERLLEKAENEKIEIAKRVAEAERRVAEAERIAEIERISKAEKFAEEERLADLERIAAETKLQEEVKIAEAKKLKEEQRILEENKILELKKIKIAMLLAEAEKAEKERKKAEAEQLAEYERIKEAKRLAFEEAIALKASEIASLEPSAFFGGRKNEQRKKIQNFLTDNISFEETVLTPSIDVLTLKGAQQDQLSNEVTELFPGVLIASYLTVSESTLSDHKIDTVVEVSNELHDLREESVIHIKLDGAATVENFDKIADTIASTTNKGGKVLISGVESTGLAATLSIAYAIKYQGIRVKNAAKMISKKRPQADLDPTILIKLSAWEWKVRMEAWKVRREQLFQQTLQLVATWLPMLSMLGLFCLALKLFQDEIERQHQMEKITPEYEYFDILKWP